MLRLHNFCFRKGLPPGTLVLFILSDNFLGLVLDKCYLGDHLARLSPIASLEGAEGLPRWRNVNVLGRGLQQVRTAALILRLGMLRLLLFFTCSC